MSPEFILLCGLLSILVMAAAAEAFERLLGDDRLPEPDRSTLRRPVVDPNWEPGEGYDRH